MNKKISFLIPAHNEEKVIRKALNNLLNLPYDNYEVIIGLDGCTDKTEEIVKEFCKKSKKFLYYSLNLRQGKPEVIDYLIKKTKGEIIIIHDADWIFRVKSKEDLIFMEKLFDDKNLGGIADSFPLHYSSNLDKKNILELGVILSTYAWMSFVKKNYTKIKNDLLILDKKNMKFPLLVNIFRKSLYKRNESLGDDFERCIDIIKSGYDVVILEDENLPRMFSPKENITLNGLLKQKERTAIARNQIKNKYDSNYKLGYDFYIYLIYFIFKLKLKEKISIIIYSIVFAFGTILSKFKNYDTKEGWNMRIKR